jgi:hypothetical protein
LKGPTRHEEQTFFPGIRRHSFRLFDIDGTRCTCRSGGHNMLKFTKRHAAKQMEKRKKKEKIEEGQKSAE